ncbi:hypothetical protein P8935_16455 [Telmatobacter sp. DSM 110680]|uniref:Flagellar protein FliT n=1 Tax=Telmatobacter sp. DSM 110680 TaxID=3036704 RepID=A0AAU7DH75_9BACT
MDPTIMSASERQPGLRSILTDASQALAHIDGDKLEEMAAYCAALIQDEGASDDLSLLVDPEYGTARKEMAIFMRVLEATRANLNVMRRLREMHVARLEYGSSAGLNITSDGSDHGDH